VSIIPAITSLPATSITSARGRRWNARLDRRDLARADDSDIGDTVAARRRIDYPPAAQQNVEMLIHRCLSICRLP
jgi:hypothetical protein